MVSLEDIPLYRTYGIHRDTIRALLRMFVVDADFRDRVESEVFSEYTRLDYAGDISFGQATYNSTIKIRGYWIRIKFGGSWIIEFRNNAERDPLAKAFLWLDARLRSLDLDETLGPVLDIALQITRIAGFTLLHVVDRTLYIHPGMFATLEKENYMPTYFAQIVADPARAPWIVRRGGAARKVYLISTIYGWLSTPLSATEYYCWKTPELKDRIRKKLCGISAGSNEGHFEYVFDRVSRFIRSTLQTILSNYAKTASILDLLQTASREDPWLCPVLVCIFGGDLANKIYKAVFTFDVSGSYPALASQRIAEACEDVD